MDITLRYFAPTWPFFNRWLCQKSESSCERLQDYLVNRINHQEEIYSFFKLKFHHSYGKMICIQEFSWTRWGGLDELSYVMISMYGSQTSTKNFVLMNSAVGEKVFRLAKLLGHEDFAGKMLGSSPTDIYFPAMPVVENKRQPRVILKSFDGLMTRRCGTTDSVQEKTNESTERERGASKGCGQRSVSTCIHTHTHTHAWKKRKTTGPRNPRVVESAARQRGIKVVVAPCLFINRNSSCVKIPRKFCSRCNCCRRVIEKSAKNQNRKAMQGGRYRLVTHRQIIPWNFYYVRIFSVSE